MPTRRPLPATRAAKAPPGRRRAPARPAEAAASEARCSGTGLLKPAHDDIETPAGNESPKGLQFSGILRHSANQENVTGSPAVGLKTDDQVFLRPAIVEDVLLQFGDLVTLRGGKVQDHWPVYQQTG